MKNKIMVISLVLAMTVSVISLSGCVEDDESELIDVLVTIVPQKEMVEAIGGPFVSVTVMVPPGQSPHSYEPTPDQMIKVARASAYFKVGSGVEFEVVHMDTILEQNSDLQVFDCSEDISVISFDEHYGKEDHREEEGEHDHEEVDEHDHGGTDPHIWTSPMNFKKMAEVVYNGLVEIDPTYQQEYYDNYQSYISLLDALHYNISELLEPFEGSSFMVYHPAWGYFADTYRLKQIAIEDEGKEPGPAGIAALIQQAKALNISVIFVSSQFDTSNAQTIADEIDGKVIPVNPLMSDYWETLMQLAKDMVLGFGS
ncbi:MAG: zinc ABC transporter substrate-binding protein [Candidatus Thermoplasmatota archaeon]|nr:zinc ABC transporter substrate-binding protein [Candidatus Thermoplasmatota archaeon]